MITPLGHRQIFQTAQAEAIRQAHDVMEQVQREAARRQTADMQLQAEAEAVHSVPHSEGIHTGERQGGGQSPGHGARDEGEPPEEEPPAGPAEHHLDLLA